MRGNMERPRLIAKIASVIYLSAALGAMFSANYYRRLPDEMFSNAGLTYPTGFTTVVIGCLIMNHYNTWAKNWTVLITITGWLSLLKGIAIIVIPQFVHTLSASLFAGRGPAMFPYVATALGFLFGCFGFVTTVPPDQSLQPTASSGPRS